MDQSFIYLSFALVFIGASKPMMENSCQGMKKTIRNAITLVVNFRMTRSPFR